MNNFIEAMRDLETGGYPGISQVYLCVLHYELQDRLCAGHHIAKHTCVQPTLVKRYLDYLLEHNYIIRVPGDHYDTYKTRLVKATTPQREQHRALLRDIARTVPMDFEDAARIERLVKEIADKSKRPDALRCELETISASLKRFGKFIGIETGRDLVELLTVINAQFGSWDDLKASQLRTLLNERLRGIAKVQQHVDRVQAHAQRVARSFAVVLKRNPEWLMANGQVRRGDFVAFCNGHFFDFPEDTVPLEAIETILDGTGIKIGGQDGKA